MRPAPPLLVAGLPYSGAAVVAEALHRAGLPLGGPFLPAADRDAVGAFIDRDIHAWHERWLGGDPAAAGQELGDLVAARFSGTPVWCIRSPHALALRDAWRIRFPDARWLVVVRHPAVQAASFAARTPEPGSGLSRSLAGRAIFGLRRWRAGYEAALQLADRQPRQVIVVDAGRFAGAAGQLASALHEPWGIRLSAEDFAGAWRPFLLRRRAPRWIRSLALLTPGVASTWRRLRQLALPASPPLPPRPGPRIAVASHWRFAPSESFIQEQLRRLPGEVHFLFRQHGTWHDRDARPLAGLPTRIACAIGRELGLDVGRADSRALRRYLRRHRIDCVLANFGRVALEAADGCRQAGVPLVAHFHGADAHRERSAPGSARFYAPLFAQAAAIVAVSRPMIERLVALGAPRERVLLNPCGVDIAEFTPGDPAAAPPRFVAAGRFVGKKGPMLTLLAFERVLRRRPDARLTMLGDGVLREACERLAEALGIDDRVEFPGAFAHAELGARLRSARAFLQHSLQQSDGDSEGLPVAVLEASASALPVVSTRHAGIPRAVVDGDTGLLCGEGDVRAMAENMLRLADDPELAAEMGRRARSHVSRHFALEVTIGRLGEIVLAAARGRPLPEVDLVPVATEHFGHEPPALAGRTADDLAQ